MVFSFVRVPSVPLLLFGAMLFVGARVFAFHPGSITEITEITVILTTKWGHYNKYKKWKSALYTKLLWSWKYIEESLVEVFDWSWKVFFQFQYWAYCTWLMALILKRVHVRLLVLKNCVAVIFHTCVGKEPTIFHFFFLASWIYRRLPYTTLMFLLFFNNHRMMWWWIYELNNIFELRKWNEMDKS